MIEKKFARAMDALGIRPATHRVLVAVSGGVDSVVLAHLLHNTGFETVVLHCNFGLRGAESLRDESFVLSMAQLWNIRSELKRFEPADFDAAGGSTQMAARQLRYQWFDGMLKQYKIPGKATVLATAHHANDQAETILMNLGRGTGIKGVAGIPMRNNDIIRPLLFATRKEIEAYAQAHELEWVEDSSNAGDQYKRNQVRQQVMPALENIFPSFAETMAANAGRFAEAVAFAEAAMQKQLQKLQVIKGNEIHVPVLKLANMEPMAYTVHSLIEPFGFNQATDTDAVIALLNAETGKYLESHTHRIIRNRNWLIISPKAAGEMASLFVLEKDSQQFSCAAGTMHWQQKAWHANTVLPADAGKAVINARDIEYPLILRKWKAGDYFYPLGMSKRKKIARFLIDQKLSKTEKENCWVLESNKRILWVVGQRIDNRFRITPGTKEVLQLEWKPSL